MKTLRIDFETYSDEPLQKTGVYRKEVQTEKLSLKAVPLANGMVKAKTENTTDATTYADWYTRRYMYLRQRAMSQRSLQRNLRK